MSSQDTSDDIEREQEPAADTDRSNDSLADKLSQELNNWRRRRTAARPRHTETDHAGSSASQTDSARTIRVRGHETLVIRKPKLAAKPANATNDRSNQ